MKCLTGHLHGGWMIQEISNKRVTNVIHVYPDLVCPTRV